MNKHYKIIFSLLGKRNEKYYCKIWGAKSKSHAINIFRTKRKNNNLPTPYINRIIEVNS